MKDLSLSVSVVVAAVVLILSYRYVFSGPHRGIMCQLFQLDAVCPAVHVSAAIDDPSFQPLIDTFRSHLELGLTVGAGFTAYVDGKRVAHLTGYVGERPYNDSTIVQVFSSGKVLEAVVIATLVDRGLLDYDGRVIDYWPEFARGDARKSVITIKDVLKHDSALPHISTGNADGKYRFEQLADHDVMKRLVEDTPLLFNGTVGRRAYHALSRGQILNQIVRLVDPKHRHIGSFAEEEIARPLGVDFHFGTPEYLDNRVYPLSEEPLPRALIHILPNILLYRTFGFGLPFLESYDNYEMMADTMTPGTTPYEWFNSYPLDFNTKLFNLPMWRRLVASSAHATSNSQSLAAISTLISQGGTFNGTTLWSKKTHSRMTHISDDEPKFCHATHMHTTFTDGGLGYLKSRSRWSPDVKWSGWGGFGGSVCLFFQIPTSDGRMRNVSIGYTMTSMGIALAERRSLELMRETEKIVRQNN